VKKVAILGSTGSIGTQALEVIAKHPDRFQVVGLAGGRNLALLREQADRFHPSAISSALPARKACSPSQRDGADIVLAATDGSTHLTPSLPPCNAGIDIAVANKELIVAAGELCSMRRDAAGRAYSRWTASTARFSNACSASLPTASPRSCLPPQAGRFGKTDARTMRTASVQDALRIPPGAWG